MRRLSKIAFFCLLFISAVNQVDAQVQNLWMNRSYLTPIESRLIDKSSNFHHDVKPYLLSEVEEAMGTDTLAMQGYFPEFTRWFDRPAAEKKFQLSAFPLLDMKVGFDSFDETPIWLTGGGAGLRINVGKRFSFYADVQYTQAEFPAFLDNFIRENSIVPGQGYARGNSPSGFLDYSGYISYSPIKYFNFQLGNGKNFFGNGYRSLLLSDNAYNSPYLKLNTNIWNIKYVNLYSLHQDIRQSPGNPAEYQYKLNSTHYLSWNITSRLTVGLFETIIWQTSDTLSQRNFDINYINPIIFYRPVEYSVGSPDNALIGLNLSYELSNDILLYGQLLFDEFLLKEMREQNGWWANKFGGQFGIKAYDINAAGGLDFQLEANVVRPFTYTHGSVRQNYAHFNQPLAHPIGTNFYEGLAIVRYRKNNWQFENKMVYAVYGRDPEGQNLGGDIYESYVSATNKYGNKIGQGIRTDLLVNSFRATHVLEPAINLQAFAEYMYRLDRTEDVPVAHSHIFSIGISTAIGNKYYDF